MVDRPFADQMFEVLDISFLELKYLQVFLRKIVSYRKKYGVHPSDTVMKSVIRTELDSESEANKVRVRDYYANILASGPPSDSEYIKQTAIDFCKKQKLKEALIKSVDLIKNSSFDEVAGVINDAISLGNSNDCGYDYLVDFEKRFEEKSRNAISTGWSIIDDLCGGGLGTGELGVVIAPTGAGKSMVLAHLGSEALKAGTTVIHYTLELADTVVASRYDSCLTKIHLKDLLTFKEKIYDEIKDIPGKLIIKEYPTKSASIQTLKNHLEKLKTRGIDPGMIIVDYADLLKPTSFTKEERRHQIESIYENLRGLSQEFRCPVWTASQTNRSGLNAEVITMESISEAFNKCFVSDFIFSLSRTIEDKTTNSGRVFVAKNRNGPDGLVYPIFMDTSNVNMKVLKQLSDEEQEIHIRVRAKEKMKRIKDLYKEHKKEEGNNGFAK